MINNIRSNENLKIIWRSGTQDDPFVPKQESLKIVNNLVTLQEIPDQFNRVLVLGYTEIYDISSLTSNTFYVNYNNGTVVFHESQNAKTVQINYSGRGVLMYPASRIYTNDETDPTLIKSIQDIIDESAKGLEALHSVQTTEQSRVNSELIRVQQESTRQSNEATRSANNTTYSQNESVRQSNETTRQNSENTRITQETQRQSAINNLTHLSNYSASTAYQPRNMVSYNGSTYMCIVQCTNILPTNTTHWRLVAQKGSDGTNLAYKGQYNSATNYVVGDLVTYEGNTYACTQTTTNRLPTVATHWGLFNSKTVVEIKSESFTCTENQTVFNLTQGQYIPNNNLLSLFIMGVKQPPSLFIETSPTRITLLQGLPTGTKVLIEYFNVINVDLQANEQARITKFNQLTHRGDYSLATSYKEFNIVNYLGSSYMCIVDSTNNLPTNTNFFKLIAQKVEVTKSEIEDKLTGTISTHNHLASSLVTDNNNLLVTSTEKTTWNNKSNLALGETSSTAYRGDRGKIAYDHSQITHAPVTAQKNSDITKQEIEDKLIGTITTHTHNASALIQDNNNRLVTDAEKIAWNGKANSTDVYTKTETDTRIQTVIGSAPAALDTLKELADALGNDANFATTVTNQLSTKVDKVTGKQLSTEDYTTPEKSKLAGIANNANNYTHPNHSGDIVSVGDGSTTIQNKVVTNTKLSDMTANTIKGRISTNGTPEDLTATQIRTIINVADGANNYVHPTSHPASMITQDSNHRFVTDTEKATWNSTNGLTLGETSTTAYRGDRGKIAYDHSQVAHAPSNAQKNSDITKAEIEAKLTGTVSTHEHKVYHVGSTTPSSTNMIWIQKV